MIFQEPMSSLNPVYTIGEQIMEAILLHQEIDVSQARNSADRGAAMPWAFRTRASWSTSIPHQFSGGMRQRVMIAMALACEPKLLFSDEPTTALDVTIQAQILELLRDLQDERNMGMMLITHDLGVVAENSDVVCVMYAGRVVEYAKVFNLFENPMHPYTRGLFASIPKLGDSRHRLVTIRDVIDNPEEFKKLPGAEKGIRPWWPQADPPPDLVGQAGTADDYVLYEIEPERWVGVWNTEAMQDMPTQRPPDLTYRVTPDEREVVKSFTEA
jgi:ABC-type dipeptide/oligopeptide/nickel transport system ATPase component